MKLSKIASAMPFAHYLGLGSSAVSAESEDDDRKQRDGESDEDYAKRMEEDDKKKEEAKKAEDEKRKEEEAKRAEGDDDDADMAEDDEDDKEEGKRAGRAKGARQRERVRCAAIVAAGVKSGAVKQACVFAFDTNLTAAQAIAALGASALDKPRGQSGLADRMASVKTPVATPQAESPNPKDPRAIAAQAIAAAARARGEA